MTLVLFIPHSEGFVLISDRQNTSKYPAVEKNEVKKLHLQSENGPAIGCAGHTFLIQTFFSDLRSGNLGTQGNICKNIEETLRNAFLKVTDDARKFGSHLEGEELRPEMLVLYIENGKIFLSKFTGFISHLITDLSKIYSVPEVSPLAARYLCIDTGKLTESEAVLVGEEILRQMAFDNYTIGPPEYHGYDVIRVNRGGSFLEYTVPKTNDRVESSDLLNYVLAKERKRSESS